MMGANELENELDTLFNDVPNINALLLHDSINHRRSVKSSMQKLRGLKSSLLYVISLKRTLCR